MRYWIVAIAFALCLLSSGTSHAGPNAGPAVLVAPHFVGAGATTPPPDMRRAPDTQAGSPTNPDWWGVPNYDSPIEPDPAAGEREAVRWAIATFLLMAAIVVLWTLTMDSGQTPSMRRH